MNSPKKQADSLWVLWLVLALLVIVTLFCIGQLALMTPPDIQAGDMRSGLKADYSLWPPLSFKPLEPELIEELIVENPDLPTQMVVTGAYWSTAIPSNTPTQPSSSTPAASPTPLPSVTSALIPLRPRATRRQQPVNTRESDIPTPLPPSATTPPTITTQPSNTPQPTRTDSPKFSPTPSNTATRTATSTNTSTATQAASPTATFTKSPTPTATATRKPPPATTNTPTATKAPFPTAIRTPLPDGINLGLPDSRYANILCGSPVIIDLGAPTQIGTLIFYEYRNQNPVACTNGICLNWVTIDLSDTSDPFPTDWPRRVFYWGDGDTTNNGSVPPAYYPAAPLPEISNLVILPTDLYNGHGIQIHVDGAYRYIRVAPPSCSNYAQLDSIEIWAATMTPRP